MRPIDPVRHANVGNAVSSTRFRLDAASTAHIVNLLTNQYSDRLLAALRELATNAADSHITAKNLAPIQVTLPSRINPNLVVEDFGLGLSIDELEGLYSSYGASTKRDSDDVNGTLGIGSKAPLAYTDTFTIQARKGGVQAQAVISKDHDGVPVLQVLDTSATGEPNGVRITVPIQEHHFHALASKAEDLFSYWEKGTVLVNGKQPQSIRDDESLVWLDDDVAVSLRRHESVIVQHNVAYPVNSYRLGLPYEVIVFVPSGTVNFTPSRESLEYTERTDEVLRLVEGYAKDTFHRVIRAKIEKATTTYERLVLVNEWRKYVPEVVQDFFGKGNPFTVKPGLHGHGWRYKPSAYKKKATKVDWVHSSDLIGEFPIVIGYDLKTLTPKSKGKADIFFADAADFSQVLFLPTGTDLSLAEGREGIYTWAEIEAAVPDSVVKKANGGYKGQTQYSVKIPGSGWDTYTLKEAKDAIADAEVTLVVYGDSSSVASYLPDAAVFDIKPNQVDKIVRETGAVNGHVVVAERRQKAFKALTPGDRYHACLRWNSSSHWSHFIPVVEEIQDPEVVAYLNAYATKNDAVSVTAQAYLNLGGSLADIARDAEAPDLVLDQRYPLVANTYYVRNNIPDAVIYINAKHQSISNTEASASPTLRKDQS